MSRFHRFLAWLFSDVVYEPCRHVSMPGTSRCMKCKHVILWAPPARG